MIGNVKQRKSAYIIADVFCFLEAGNDCEYSCLKGQCDALFAFVVEVKVESFFRKCRGCFYIRIIDIPLLL